MTDIESASFFDKAVATVAETRVLQTRIDAVLAMHTPDRKTRCEVCGTSWPCLETRILTGAKVTPA